MKSAAGEEMKKVATVLPTPEAHWVGDGFPVRSLFSYGLQEPDISPFLLFDHAGPHSFGPGDVKRPRGVGVHPHRGFETVTIVYHGEVSHRDSAGHGGTIGPGDVQWMTAAGGILHEEFHSPNYTRSGGPFHMVQLWVNLPASHKMNPPGYQAILATEIPTVDLSAGGGGKLRVIAGAQGDVCGPARTVTPMNVWDLQLRSGQSATLTVPAGHNALVAVLTGRVHVGENAVPVKQDEVAVLERSGMALRITADTDCMVLVLTGEPLGERVVGYGPFVMNTREQIMQAIDDFNRGKFGEMPIDQPAV